MKFSLFWNDLRGEIFSGNKQLGGWQTLGYFVIYWLNKIEHGQCGILKLIVLFLKKKCITLQNAEPSLIVSKVTMLLG